MGAIALVFLNVVTRNLDHDENQFIASAYLTPRQGLIPYRDYPFFHTPYLILVYALAFKITSHLLLAARLISIACGVGVFAIVLREAAMATEQLVQRRTLMICTGILFLMNPLFTHTSGRAWNHDFPLFLTICGFIAFNYARSARASLCWLAVAGGCIGIAAGTRITFTPVLAAVAIIIWIEPHWKRQRTLACACTLAGFSCAIAPCIGLFLYAPAQFLFGNFRYPFFNLSWRSAAGELSGIGVRGHLGFIVKHILNQPGNSVILILFISSCVPLFMNGNWRNHPRWLSALLFTVGLFPGALIPTPSFYPYFYAPMPFMLISAIYGAIHVSAARQAQWRIGYVLAAIGVIPGGALVYAYAVDAAISFPWTPTTIHRDGRIIADRADGGRVLTLAPLVIAEGGLPLYPQFSTGSFAFRIAPFVEEDEEQRQMLPDADDLDEILAAGPPVMVVTSAEGKLDTPLRSYAQRHHLPLWALNKDDEIVFADVHK